MADPSTYVQINRTYHGIDQWRNTTYRGPDGHEVQVAVPRRAWLDKFDPSCVDHWDYDEKGEQRMLASLVERHVRGTDDR